MSALFCPSPGPVVKFFSLSAQPYKVSASSMPPLQAVDRAVSSPGLLSLWSWLGTHPVRSSSSRDTCWALEDETTIIL